MIDWLTLKIDLADLGCPDLVEGLRKLNNRIQCIDPLTGEIEWEKAAWETIRSDSHGLTFVVGTELQIQGSPARCWRNGCNVFGSSNMLQCARLMVSLFRRSTGLNIPDPAISRPDGAPLYRVSRVDVTNNYFLGSLANVRTALNYLRGCEGGRYRVNQTSGDTVYWSKTSRRRSGKAYAKGPHIRYWIKKNAYNSPSGFGFTMYSDEQLKALDSILRLELKLGSQFWHDYNECGGDWRTFSEAEQDLQHASFFERMIGDSSIDGVDMQLGLLEKIREGAVSLGMKETQGDRAHSTYRMIQAMGWEHAREITSKSTWYRHMSILRASGMGDLDISHGQIVPLRRSIDLVPVSCWNSLSHAA